MKPIIFQISFIIGFFLQSIFLLKNHKYKKNIFLGSLVFGFVITLTLLILMLLGKEGIKDPLNVFTMVFCGSFILAISFYFVSKIKDQINFFLIFQIILISLIFILSQGNTILITNEAKLLSLNYSANDIDFIKTINWIFFIPLIILIISLITKKIKNNLTIFSYTLIILYFQLINLTTIIPKDGTNLLESYNIKTLSTINIFDTILLGGIFFQIIMTIIINSIVLVGGASELSSVFQKKPKGQLQEKKISFKDKKFKKQLIKISIITLLSVFPSFFFSGIDLARFLALVLILHPIFITYYLRFTK